MNKKFYLVNNVTKDKEKEESKLRRRRDNRIKKLLLIYGGILLILISISVILFREYSKKIRKAAKESLISAQKIADLVPNDNMYEEVSSEISKSIEEALNVLKEENVEEVIEIPEEQESETEVETNSEEVVQEEQKKELEFIYPVEGEIIKEYAIDNLVFSETLQEWIVHSGIDIKAPRTTVVKSAEEGMVKAIKNDPRYGLTIIIEHRDGYKTIYANLLTTEFVREGEEVSKGQTIGTVGNSAAFEIADEPHLHFEILKDEEPQDPTLYL